MDLAAIGSLLGGAGQAAGGIAGLFSGGRPDMTAVNQSFAQNQFNAANALQKEFAQNGIRWRVADAKAAGLHPLAAIGASGASYSPSLSVLGDSGPSGSRDIGASLANMGQGIGRAVAATQTQAERVGTATQLVHEAQRTQFNDKQLQLLDLQIQASQLNLARQAGTGPGMPSSVTGSPAGRAGLHGVSETPPYETPSVNPTSPYAGAGSPQAEIEWRNNSAGGLSAFPAKGLNMDEIGTPGYISWMYRNSVLPLFGNKVGQPPASYLPQGAISWRYSGPRDEWVPVYPSRDFSHLPQRPGPRSRAGELPWPNWRN